MADPLRNLRRAWHLAVGTARHTHFGVRLKTGPGVLPKSVRSHIFKGGYEDVEAELVNAVVRPGDIVLEVGTGIGFVSILCTKRAGQGQVESYEANPALEQIIRDNYAENGLKPNLRMRAVTVDGSPIRFFADPGILSSSLIDRNLQAQEITVESVPISVVMQDTLPDVIVMDVEGAEVDLLTAADLTDVRAMIVEVHPHIVGADKIAAMDAVLAEKGMVPTEQRHKTVLYQRRAP